MDRDDGVIDASSYDLDAERARYAFPDVTRGGFRLNRGTAVAEHRTADPAGFEAVRVAHNSVVTNSTLALDSPVIELDQPTTGIYAGSRGGVYLDLYQGVAQRLFDDARLRPLVQPVIDAGLLLRREINTDDYLGFPPAGVYTPQDVAELITAEAQRAFPRPDGYRVFFANSGTEAIEAALKASTRTAYRRVRERYSVEMWAALCAELGIARHAAFSTEVWRDYPLFVIALHGAFHGRTLGSLALTESRAAQRIGFPLWRWVVHVPRDDAAAVRAVIERRPLPDLLAEPGALRRVVAEGRVPIDLLAGAFVEPFQGEGGYRATSREVLRALRVLCDETGALLVADEVQSFARAGATFYSELTGVRPDVLCMAKAAVLGLTVMPARVAEMLESGWHSNTFGSGRVFDVNYSHAVLDTWLHVRDELFAGASFAENETVKGTLLGNALARLAEDYPGVLSEPEGAGCLWGITVASRPAFIQAAWLQGAKLLGAGAAEQPGRVRLILPADVLAREVDAVVEVLRRTCAALRSNNRSARES